MLGNSAPAQLGLGSLAALGGITAEPCSTSSDRRGAAGTTRRRTARRTPCRCRHSPFLAVSLAGCCLAMVNEVAEAHGNGAAGANGEAGAEVFNKKLVGCEGFQVIHVALFYFFFFFLPAFQARVHSLRRHNSSSGLRPAAVSLSQPLLLLPVTRQAAASCSHTAMFVALFVTLTPCLALFIGTAAPQPPLRLVPHAQVSSHRVLVWRCHQHRRQVGLPHTTPCCTSPPARCLSRLRSHALNSGRAGAAQPMADSLAARKRFDCKLSATSSSRPLPLCGRVQIWVWAGSHTRGQKRSVHGKPPLCLSRAAVG